ncbi:hypothetical protein ABH09_01130 [Treponema sp. OMZ 803]|uniref:hypothetical protein n=1 Tax=Treponema sp. OMZ 803 TaxID=120682 RepID=UPI0020A2B79B|nr:hypothetical protein [Treponema sp. OMZ 803]UTC53315.1 hypothetical protein ABH09_01130 [Treponema sp. OMZ 803]
MKNINRLIKGSIFFLLFFTQTLYADISFDKDNAMYYESLKNNYRIEELYIQNNTYYVKVKDKWLVFYEGRLIGEFNYTSLVVTKNGLLGKNNTYTLLSNDLKVLQDNLLWASINDNGIIIKEKNKELLAISPDGSKKTLKGYDYAEMCSNGFYIAWNVTRLIPRWFLLNTKGKMIASTDENIIEFDGKFFIKKDNKIIVIENYKKKVLDEKYSDFMDGREYIFLFNNGTKRWEVHDSNLNYVLEIDLPNVSTSMVCHNIFLIYDRQAEILIMYKIDTHTSMIIDDYRIGEDYLFIKYENAWKRIY